MTSSYGLEKAGTHFTTGLGLSDSYILGPPNDPQLDFNQVVGRSAQLSDAERNQRGGQLLSIRDQYAAILKPEIADLTGSLFEKGYRINLGATAKRLKLCNLVFEDAESELGEEAQKGATVTTRNAGGYNALERSAIVILGDDEPSLANKSAARHELLHAASRQVFAVRDGRIDQNYRPTIGLRLGGPMEYREIYLGVGHVLNEAITERLCVEMQGAQQDHGERKIDQGIYWDERQLLDKIIDLGGIGVKLFVEAYFEEPIPGNPLCRTMPIWRELVDQLDEKFGPRFLSRLNRFLINDRFGLDSLLSDSYSGPLEMMRTAQRLHPRSSKSSK